jgi:hypothetical protein
VLAAQALEPGEPDRPLRIKNFAAIRLGHQLLRQDERYWLVFSADETKAGQPWEAVFPETLLPCLARYLEHHRPVLLRGERGTVPANIDALWVSEIATQLELGALGRRIRIHTDRAFGVSLPPHWFRDAAATTIAIEDPKHVRDAQLFAPCTVSMSPPIAVVCVNSVGLPQRLRFFRLLERSLATMSCLY